MCFVWISEQTVIFVFYIFNRLVFITEVEYLLRGTHESLYNTHKFRP